jgi:acetyl esterase
MGDSAGGNLAAAVCLKLKDRGRQHLVAGQILLYPVIDFSAMDTDSYKLFDRDYMLSKVDMEWFRDCYLPNPEDRNHPYVSMSRAENLADLPRALIFTAQFDVLRDEGQGYAELLRKAGNSVSHSVIKGMTHGFMMMDAFLPQPGRVFSSIKRFVYD